MTTDPAPPQPRTARELAARLMAERGGAPFLLYRDGTEELQIVSLEPRRARLTLGRDPANDVTLDWDQEVSRVHAELELIAGQWAVADDGLSRNGTFVNGTPAVGRRRLRDGDCVRVGRTVLVYREPVASVLGATVAAASSAPIEDELTPMQRRILRALCRPLVEAGGVAQPASNRDVAAEVHLSVDGVKAQLRTLSERFGVAELPQNRKRLELAQRALRAGLGGPARV
jgi:pSer/pThr/pTyr-binding forkhead associated (FHA) protein